MSHEDIVRAWKDPEYRAQLSEEQRQQLPENPAGDVELSDDELRQIQGGFGGFCDPMPATLTTITGTIITNDQE